MTNSEYIKRPEGGVTVFEVKPATLGKNLILFVIGILFIINGASCVFGSLFSGHLSSFFTGLIMSLIFAGIGFLLIKLSKNDSRPKPHKIASTFKVTPTSIEVNGRVFNKEDIHRLIIKNAISNEVVSAPTLVVTNNFGGQLAAGGANIGAAIRAKRIAKLTAVGYALDLEAGGKATTLGGGMDETTAFGLLSDVSKILGFSTK